jgi:hypothetical protein
MRFFRAEEPVSFPVSREYFGYILQYAAASELQQAVPLAPLPMNGYVVIPWLLS